MTPIHIDPENPAMPISHPAVYAVYLAKKQGPFATLGLAEDTWALNERVIDEQAFFEQAMAICDERERMFLDALRADEEGPRHDRLRHDRPRAAHVLPLPRPDAPGERGQGHRRAWTDAIARVYERMDALLGRLCERGRRDPTRSSW